MQRGKALLRADTKGAKPTEASALEVVLGEQSEPASRRLRYNLHCGYSLQMLRRRDGPLIYIYIYILETSLQAGEQ